MLIKLSIPRIPNLIPKEITQSEQVHMSPAQAHVANAGLFSQPTYQANMMGLNNTLDPNGFAVFQTQMTDFYILCDKAPSAETIVNYFKKKIKETDVISEICEIAYYLETMSNILGVSEIRKLTKYGDRIVLPVEHGRASKNFPVTSNLIVIIEALTYIVIDPVKE